MTGSNKSADLSYESSKYMTSWIQWLPDCQPVRLSKLNFLELYKTLFTKFLNLIGQPSKAGARNVTN